MQSSIPRGAPFVLIAAALLLAQAAEAEPPTTRESEEAGLQVEGLLADLERIVETEESLGWFIDESEYQDLRVALMETVCRTLPEARAAALVRIEAASRKAGDPKALFSAAGSEFTDDVERALSLERQAFALRLALDQAKGDCPFWIVPEASFEGRQTDRNRFTLAVESGGLGQIRNTVGTWTLGGGGLIRVLPTYGFGGKVSILLGGEFGGGAMIVPRSKPTEFVVNYFPAIPLVIRFRDVSWHYDIEVGGVSLFQADNTRFSYGVRTGFSVGVSGLKRNSLVPWAGATLAYDHYFPSGGRPRASFIRGGLRGGVFWDP